MKKIFKTISNNGFLATVFGGLALSLLSYIYTLIKDISIEGFELNQFSKSLNIIISFITVNIKNITIILLAAGHLYNFILYIKNKRNWFKGMTQTEKARALLIAAWFIDKEIYHFSVNLLKMTKLVSTKMFADFGKNGMFSGSIQVTAYTLTIDKNFYMYARSFFDKNKNEVFFARVFGENDDIDLNDNFVDHITKVYYLKPLNSNY